MPGLSIFYHRLLAIGHSRVARYSRSAVTGLTLVARTAGTKQATTAVKLKTMMPDMIAAGS